MHLKVTAQRTLILSPEAIEDITVEVSEFVSGDGQQAARLRQLHDQVHQALDSIEADVREPQPRPALHLAGQGSH